MDKMFSISSQSPGEERVSIKPEAVSANGRTIKFQASLMQGTRLEAKFRGEHVTGSPFTYRVSTISPSNELTDEAQATAGLRRMKIFQDLEKAIAEKETSLKHLYSFERFAT